MNSLLLFPLSALWPEASSTVAPVEGSFTVITVFSAGQQLAYSTYFYRILPMLYNSLGSFMALLSITNWMWRALGACGSCPQTQPFLSTDHCSLQQETKILASVCLYLISQHSKLCCTYLTVVPAEAGDQNQRVVELILAILFSSRERRPPYLLLQLSSVHSSQLVLPSSPRQPLLRYGSSRM